MRACNAPATGQTDAGVPACDRCLAAIKAMEKTRP